MFSGQLEVWSSLAMLVHTINILVPQKVHSSKTFQKCNLRTACKLIFFPYAFRLLLETVWVRTVCMCDKQLITCQLL